MNKKLLNNSVHKICLHSTKDEFNVRLCHENEGVKYQHSHVYRSLLSKCYSIFNGLFDGHEISD